MNVNYAKKKFLEVVEPTKNDLMNGYRYLSLCRIEQIELRRI